MLHPANHDAALWQSFKQGDPDSFRAIYFQHFSPLYEYGVRLSNNRELVKDCIHDLFIKLWNNKDHLGNVSAARSYLLVALRSTLYNKLKQGTRFVAGDLNEDYPFEMEFSTEAALIAKESRTQQLQQLADAIKQLTPRQKEVIYLRYFEELSYEEIAAVMGITVKATYKLTARGLEALRQIMDVPGPAMVLLLALACPQIFHR